MGINKYDYAAMCQCTGALICALKHRDLHTQLHSDRVVYISEEIGIACKLSRQEVDVLKISACFHDVGKVGIPDHILLKPGKHNKDEWDIMKTHSTIGEDIVRRLELEDGETIAKAVRHHHEYFNGEGYPDKLCGDQIPLLSKIISISDSYDAMTNTRPYHQARTHQQALEILIKEKGEKSDPHVFNIFLSIIENSRYRSK